MARSRLMKRSGSASGGIKGRRAGVFYSERMKSNNQPLRNLTQMPYPEVVNITEKNANQQFIVSAAIAAAYNGQPDDFTCVIGVVCERSQ